MEKIEQMKVASPDDAAIKFQEEKMDQSKQMIPHCEQKIAQAQQTLQSLLKQNLQLKESQEYQEAKRALEESGMLD